jgi:hypothetical protein
MMATKQQDKEKQPTDREKHERQLNALLGKHVINALGQPGNLFSLQVRELWKDHYRVNVMVGVDAGSVKVAHSFFLVADDDGNVIASTPLITKHY